MLDELKEWDCARVWFTREGLEKYKQTIYGENYRDNLYIRTGEKS